MANATAIFIYNDTGKTAGASGITASTQAAGFSASNIIVDHRQVPSRNAAVTASWWQWTFAANVQPTCIGIVDHNITSGRTVMNVQSATNVGFTLGVATISASPITWRSGIIWDTWATPTARQWWRLNITDAANPAGYMQLGRVILGGYFQPVTNWEVGFKRGISDKSIIQNSLNFVDHGVSKPLLDSREFTFPVLTAAELANWVTLYNTVGKTLPFVAVFDPTANPNTETFYGKFKEDLALNNVYQTLDEVVMSFLEAA